MRTYRKFGPFTWQRTENTLEWFAFTLTFRSLLLVYLIVSHHRVSLHVGGKVLQRNEFGDVAVTIPRWSHYRWIPSPEKGQ